MDADAAKLLGAGLAVLGVIGPGVGIGLVFSSFIAAVGRNPASEAVIRTWALVGAALVEALGIFALVIALILLFVF